MTDDYQRQSQDVLQRQQGGKVDLSRADAMISYRPQANRLNSGSQAVPSRPWAVGKETGATRQWALLANGAKGRKNANLAAFCKAPSTGIVDKQKMSRD
ncbi:MAG: hypothetical protein ACOYMG_07860 [Candidatus Methylumidiphilus sp.]